jgi:hypothetical protein
MGMCVRIAGLCRNFLHRLRDGRCKPRIFYFFLFVLKLIIIAYLLRRRIYNSLYVHKVDTKIIDATTLFPASDTILQRSLSARFLKE